MLSRSRLSGLFVAVTFSIASPALSQNNDARALDLGREGVALFEQGKWADAHAKFKAAESLSHSPVFGLYIARSLANAKQLLAARDAYRAVVDEALAEDAPSPWTKAKLDATAELLALDKRIPSFVVVVKRAPGPTTVRLDGRTVAPGATLEVDPGEHVVRATAGDVAREVRVEAFDGRRAIPVEIDLGVDAPASKGDAGELGGAPAAPGADEPGPLAPGAVLLGLGSGALVAGAVTAGLALTKASDIEALCGGDTARCPTSLKSVIDPEVETANTLGYVSTAMFVAGGALVTTGIVLVIVRPGGGPAASSSNGATVWMQPTPGGIGWAGRF